MLAPASADSGPEPPGAGSPSALRCPGKGCGVARSLPLSLPGSFAPSRPSRPRHYLRRPELAAWQRRARPRARRARPRPAARASAPSAPPPPPFPPGPEGSSPAQYWCPPQVPARAVLPRRAWGSGSVTAGTARDRGEGGGRGSRRSAGTALPSESPLGQPVAHGNPRSHGGARDGSGSGSKGRPGAMAAEVVVVGSCMTDLVRLVLDGGFLPELGGATLRSWERRASRCPRNSAGTPGLPGPGRAGMRPGPSPAGVTSLRRPGGQKRGRRQAPRAERSAPGRGSRGCGRAKDRARTQIAQTGHGVSITGDIQERSGCDPVPCALG